MISYIKFYIAIYKSFEYTEIRKYPIFYAQYIIFTLFLLFSWVIETDNFTIHLNS